MTKVGKTVEPDIHVDDKGDIYVDDKGRKIIGKGNLQQAIMAGKLLNTK